MNILLTSAGRRGYLVRFFKEAIAEGEVHAANSSKDSTAMYFADKAVVTPLIYDDAYIPFLLNYCVEQRIDAIIPLFDVDLPILAKNKNKFEELGITVIVSSAHVIEMCNDKWKTFNFLISNGFHTPITFLSLETAFQAIHKNEVRFPMIVKPRWGMGSLLVFEAENKEELAVFYNKVKRNIARTYLTYESQHNLEESVIIQEKITGQEYGLDIINNLQGNYETTIVKKKLSMRAGETDCAEVVMNEELCYIGERLSKKIGHIGNLDVDVFNNEKGSYILELNARFGGGYPFSHLAGVNLPKAIISWVGNSKSKNDELVAKIGIVGYKDMNIVSDQRLVMSFLS